MKKNISKIIQYILFLGLGGYLLYTVFTDPAIDIQNVWYKILNAKWEWIGISIFVFMLTHISRAIRWKLLLEGTGYHTKLINIYNALMSGYFTNTAIPRVGEFVRCGLVKKSDNVPFTTAFGTAMVERLTDILMLIILVFTGLYLQYDIISGFFDENIFTPISNWIVEKATRKNLIILGVVIVAIIYGLYKSQNKIEKAVEKKGNGSVDDIVDDIWDGLGSILKLKKIGQFILHTLLIWVGYCFTNYFCFFAFDQTSSLTLLAGLSVLIVGSVAKMIPTQGHGAGTYHFIIPPLLLLYSIDKEDGLALATIIHGSQFLYYVFGGLISYVWITFFTPNNFIPDTANDEK